MAHGVSQLLPKINAKGQCVGKLNIAEVNAPTHLASATPFKGITVVYVLNLSKPVQQSPMSSQSQFHSANAMQRRTQAVGRPCLGREVAVIFHRW